MTNPRNAAAPGVGTEGERVEIQHDNHVSLVSFEFAKWASADTRAEACEVVARRTRLSREQERRQASRELDRLFAFEPLASCPSTYMMPSAQRLAYGRYLLAEGWMPWEVRARLVAPEGVTA